MNELPRLRTLPAAVRVGLTGLVLTLAGGYAASLAHIVDHHGQKDDEPGLSMDDLVGAYHGVDRAAPLLAVIEGPHGRQYLASAEERDALNRWLAGENKSGAFDSLDAGDMAPVEILDRNCLQCHARNASEGGGIGRQIPLEYWDDVARLAFAQRLDPPPLEILTVSTHTHALTMPLVALAACALFLLTRWPASLRHAAFLAAGLGCLLDVGGWWLARESAAAVWLVIGGGALYGAGVLAALLGVLAELWLPAKRA